MIKKRVWQLLNFLHKYISAPRMIMGYKNADGVYCPLTRISNTCSIINRETLNIGDNVFIGHYNFIEASHNIIIGEGCQITNFVTISSHSSHNSIRLYGREYIGQSKYIGYLKGSIVIGKYTFIGPHTTIMPNTIIGKGSIVKAYSLVKGEFPDFAIIAGNPATIIGDTRDIDNKYLKQENNLQGYYNEWADTTTE